MKNLTLLTYLLLGHYSILIAQTTFSKTVNNIKLTGTIIEYETKKALEYATILLTNEQNNTIFGGITDTKGNFSITVPKGIYTIKIEFIGFKTLNLAKKQLIKNTHLGTITLNESSESLKEVEIIAEKSTLDIRLDKKIYNVGKDMTLKGGTASDVLDNVPSVNVDPNGTISLRGNEGVRILINGKPAALLGLKSSNILQSLPAKSIKKIEVITSPSAKYDAEGSAGIVNIIIRKPKKDNFNGTFNTTFADPKMLRFSANINYKTSAINIFSNIGFVNENTPIRRQIQNKNYSNGVVNSYRNEDEYYNHNENTGYNGILGIEYYINKTSSLTGSLFYSKNTGDFIGVNDIKNYDADDLIISIDKRIEVRDQFDLKKQYALNYTNTFNEEGKKLTIDFQYEKGKECDFYPITVNGNLSEQNTEKEISKDYLFQVDYVLPVNKQGQLEFGHKTMLLNLNANFTLVDQNGKPFSYDPSNHSDYHQNIYAFYTQFGKKFNHFSYLLGLRSEITHISLHEIRHNTKNNKKYTEWFPTLNLSYKFNKKNQLTLGYNRRIRRPPLWLLNPSESRRSPINILKGNLNINPAFTHQVELGFSTKKKLFTFAPAIYYNYSSNIIQFITIKSNRTINGVNTDVFINYPTNLSTKKRYGLELVAKYKPNKWARFSADFNYYHSNTGAANNLYRTVNNRIIKTQIPAFKMNRWFTRLKARITLPTKVQWQTKILISDSFENAQTYTKERIVTSMSFSKQFLQKRAAIVFNVRDMFNSNKTESISYIGERHNPTNTIESSFQRRFRQISLSFSYKLNKNKNRR